MQPTALRDHPIIEIGDQEEVDVLNLKIYRVMPVMFILLVRVSRVREGTNGDVYFGGGSASDGSTNQSINTFGDGNVYHTPKLGGAFGKFGADYMFKPTLGFGGEYSFRFAQAPYAGLNYRPKFYDFNAIWMPISSSKQVVPELQAGIGGATLSFYFPQQCIGGLACSSSTYLVSSSHFQTHLSAGLRLYVKGGIFIRPQFDIHYVHNFYQFSSSWVPEYGAVIGYTFGRQ